MNMEMTPVMQEKFPVMEKFLLAELSKLNVDFGKNRKCMNCIWPNHFKYRSGIRGNAAVSKK